MTRDLPLRIRLTIWYTAVLSLGLVVFSWTVWIGLRHTLTADVYATLLNQARGFEEYLQIEDRDQPSKLNEEIDEYSRSLPLNHVLVVYDGSDQLIYSNAGADSRKFAVLSESNQPRQIEWRNKPYSTISQIILLNEGSYRVFLAISSESVERPIHLLGWLLLLTVPMFVLCAAAGGYWLSRKALLPVDRITERARTIGVNNLSERLLIPETNDELQRLTETWNGMLERLETAVSRLSRFTADASHELRTPVAIVRLAAENALRRNRSEAEYRAALQHIQRESENMTQLIGDLLFLARADARETSDETEPLALHELVESVCADLHGLASAKDIALTTKLPSSPVIVSGDLSGLRRLLVILLDNAIKYTPEGGLVSVELEEEKTRAIIRVEDTGIGIPESSKGRLFQRFFRADPSRSKESGGYGLGLAIAHAIVEQNEGSIEVQSVETGGSVFVVTLPLGTRSQAGERIWEPGPAVHSPE